MKATHGRFAAIFRQLGLVALCGSALLACAEGSPSAPAMQFAPPAAEVVATCGNGLMDPGEQCECERIANNILPDTCPIANANVTCASMMRGTGTILCNRCAFDTSMCTSGTPGISGSGGGGTGR